MRTAVNKVDVASDHRRRWNVPRHILLIKFFPNLIVPIFHLHRKGGPDRWKKQEDQFPENLHVRSMVLTPWKAYKSVRQVQDLSYKS